MSWGLYKVHCEAGEGLEGREEGGEEPYTENKEKVRKKREWKQKEK
jgi:hypothetical protein